MENKKWLSRSEFPFNIALFLLTASAVEAHLDEGELRRLSSALSTVK
jgi:hypothetical protein